MRPILWLGLHQNYSKIDRPMCALTTNRSLRSACLWEILLQAKKI
ncbi:hypothetical protein AVEN_132275-1, partial [Araneus ventricosus]